MKASVLELLASRICHDLVSPVGAINNGVEFMQEMGADAGGEAIDLIAHSAEIAAARLQVFRIVYGMGGAGTDIKPADIYEAFGALIKSEDRLSQDWDPESLQSAGAVRGFCKILMGALIFAQECLPRGGVISVSAEAPETVRIEAKGEGASPRPQALDALAQELSPDNLDPRLVHPYLLAVFAKEYGLSVSAAMDGDTVVLILRC